MGVMLAVGTCAGHAGVMTWHRRRRGLAALLVASAALVAGCAPLVVREANPAIAPEIERQVEALPGVADASISYSISYYEDPFGHDDYRATIEFLDSATAAEIAAAVDRHREIAASEVGSRDLAPEASISHAGRSLTVPDTGEPIPAEAFGAWMEPPAPFETVTLVLIKNEPGGGIRGYLPESRALTDAGWEISDAWEEMAPMLAAEPGWWREIGIAGEAIDTGEIPVAANSTYPPDLGQALWDIASLITEHPDELTRVRLSVNGGELRIVLFTQDKNAQIPAATQTLIDERVDAIRAIYPGVELLTY